MAITRYIRGCIWVLWLSQICLAQSVTVRVVNELNAKPLANQSVLVQFLFHDPSKTSSVLRFETDANGETRFSLPEPAPERMDVEISLASKYWHCSCWVTADTETIIHSGLLQVPKTEPPVHPFPPANKEPGRVIFIARPYAALEMLLRPPGAPQAAFPRPPENRPDRRCIIAAMQW